MVISNRRNIANDTILTLGLLRLERVTTYRYLGGTIDCRNSLRPHIDTQQPFNYSSNIELPLLLLHGSIFFLVPVEFATSSFRQCPSNTQLDGSINVLRKPLKNHDTRVFHVS